MQPSSSISLVIDKYLSLCLGSALTDSRSLDMFKHVLKKRSGSEVTSSGSESELDPEIDDEAEFVGFGSDNGGDTDGDSSESDIADIQHGTELSEMEVNEEEEEEESEELPANLPNLQEAITEPIFELNVDAKGRKNVRKLFSLSRFSDRLDSLY